MPEFFIYEDYDKFLVSLNHWNECNTHGCVFCEVITWQHTFGAGRVGQSTFPSHNSNCVLYVTYTEISSFCCRFRAGFLVFFFCGPSCAKQASQGRTSSSVMLSRPSATCTCRHRRCMAKQQIGQIDSLIQCVGGCRVSATYINVLFLISFCCYSRSFGGAACRMSEARQAAWPNRSARWPRTRRHK